MIVVLGAGYTGARVVHRVLTRGGHVLATGRSGASVGALAELGAETWVMDADDAGAVRALRGHVPEGARVLWSIPAPHEVAAARARATRVIDALTGKAARVVLISSTGVYGDVRDVDEHTVPAPANERHEALLAVEEAVRAGPWRSLVLRAAGIYGPDRGVHVAIAERRFRLPADTSRLVSRIHVDDLASLALAGVDGDLEGAYPVGDDRPCTSREIAEHCVARFGLTMPAVAEPGTEPDTLRFTRNVEGRALRRALGVQLRFPTYVEGLASAALPSGRGSGGAGPSRPGSGSR